MNRQIFENIRALKRQLLPNDRVILFGSQARGDAQPDSDWDLLVLLNRDGKITYADENKYAYPFAEMGWDYGAYISVKMYTAKEWEQRSFTPFYHNVENDGILIS
ncbi:MAG: nucleotidyltransferase domain-containing protein [Prevotellaceae bacterium]|jgi:predicted nucleotidyltransferase|nr:nucleotidyltransferase domain-containing protein [Prevotellaceae bacterium]